MNVLNELNETNEQNDLNETNELNEPKEVNELNEMNEQLSLHCFTQKFEHSITNYIITHYTTQSANLFHSFPIAQ